MNKEKLRQYRDLVEEVKYLQGKYEDSKKVVQDKVTGSNPNFPYNIQEIVIEGINEDDYRKYSILLKNKIKELIKTKMEIETFIMDIPDSRIRRIFYMRYIEGYTWLKISMKLGSYDESYSRKLHDRYIIS